MWYSVKEAAQGRELEILFAFGGIPIEYLDGRHHPCPKCGGKDRFRLIDPQAGAVLCNQCFRQKNGDFIAAICWIQNIDYRSAIRGIGDYLRDAPASFVPFFASGRKMHSMKSDAPTVGHKVKNEAPARILSFEYCDGAGEKHVRIDRLEYSDGKKSFRQFHWDRDRKVYVPGTRGVTHVPFDAPSFKEAERVYWVEGEKKCLQLAKLLEDSKPEICCSTKWGGSGNFPEELIPWFRSKEVFILLDGDEPGRRYGNMVAESIHSVAKSICLVPITGFHDIGDWISQGKEVAQ